ncbi:MAG: type II secretion system F family protein [archaeon]|nr:type II secretion system F family protein [archaeon]
MRKMRHENFFAQRLGRAILLSGAKIGQKEFFLYATAVGALCFLGFLYATLFVLEHETLGLFSPLAFFLPAVLGYFYLEFLGERNKKSIEEGLPDLLLIASSMPRGAFGEKCLEFVAANGEGVLAKEMEAANVEVKNGSTIEDALLRLSEKWGSAMLSRAIGMLVDAMESGADASEIFRETAEDIMQTNAVFAERRASAEIEKYTILFAGGIIVPLLLGLMAGMAQGFNFSGISELGLGLSDAARNELANASGIATIAYIIEYAIIGSVFVAFQENSPKKAVLYASALVPLGLLFYFLAKSGFTL